MPPALDDFGREPPTWFAPENDDLQRSATAVLRDALAIAAAERSNIDALWDTFQAFMLRYQYGEFMDQIVRSSYSRVEQAIQDNEYDALRAKAIEALRVEVREHMTKEVREKLRPEIEEQLRAELRSSVRSAVVEQLNGELLAIMKPAVERQLRSDLMGDPEFVAEVKAELQRKMLGL